MHNRKQELLNYIGVQPHSILPSLGVMAVFLAAMLLLGSQLDSERGSYMLLIGLGLAGYMLYKTVSKTHSEGNYSLARIQETGSLDKVLADFATAQEVPGLCKVGQRYFFGFGNGIILDLNEVTRVTTEERIIHDADGSKRREVLCLMGPRTVCLLNSEAQCRRAAEMLKLLNGKCRLEEDVLHRCYLWDYERNAPGI